MTNIHLLMKNKDEDKNSYFIEVSNYLLNGIENDYGDFLELKQKINQGRMLYNKLFNFFDSCGEGHNFYPENKDDEMFNLYDVLYDLQRYPIKQIEKDFITPDFFLIISDMFKLHDMLFNNNQLFKIVEDMTDNEYSISDFEYYTFSEDEYTISKQTIPNFYNEVDKYTGQEFQSDLLALSFIKDTDNYEDRKEFEFKHYRLKEF